MKILITGASGNVGYQVAQALIKKNQEIIIAGPDLENMKKLYGNEIEARYLDFTDEQSFVGLLSDVDRVFLMRPPHLGNPSDLLPFIKEMKKNNIKLVSFLSLMGVEKNTIPPHHKIEKYIEQYEIPYAHIRPGFFMQNISGIHAEEIKEHDMIFVPAGKSKTSFIDAKDIGLAIATVLSNEEKYKNTKHTITGPVALDYYEVANILSKVLNRKIEYKKPGYLKYRHYYIKTRNLDKKYVNVTVALYFMTRMGTAKQVTNEFYELTGKNPTTFEEFAYENKTKWIK